MNGLISRLSVFFSTRPSLRKLAWFVAIYVVSVVVFVIIAFILQALVPK